MLANELHKNKEV